MARISSTEIVYKDKAYAIVGACFEELCDEHRAQVHNYLKPTGYKLGLLISFGHHPKLQYERIIR